MEVNDRTLRGIRSWNFLAELRSLRSDILFYTQTNFLILQNPSECPLEILEIRIDELGIFRNNGSATALQFLAVIHLSDGGDGFSDYSCEGHRERHDHRQHAAD